MYATMMSDWILFSTKKTTEGMIAYKGSPTYKIYCVEIAKFAFINVALLFICGACLDFEEDIKTPPPTPPPPPPPPVATRRRTTKRRVRRSQVRPRNVPTT